MVAVCDPGNLKRTTHHTGGGGSDEIGDPKIYCPSGHWLLFVTLGI